MKKKFSLVASLVVFTAAITLSGCADKVKEAVDCTKLTADVTAAITSYTTDPTNADKCTALKTAYQAAIDASCPGSETYPTAISILPC